MIFKCKNCGGNTVYDPESHKMYCPYCDSQDSEEPVTEGQSLYYCISCGGQLQVDDFTSAARCPYCDNYIIFDERVSGEYEPHLILPFMLGREKVKQLMRDKFKKCVFAPSSFLSEAKLDSMTGMYVPFWMYDYHVHGAYDGQGNVIRTWVSGSREYTETSTFHIERDMEADFDKMPVDASLRMADDIMDLMEPYDYKALEAFKAKYMSGFFAERFNMPAVDAERRAVDKAKIDAENILRQSMSGYTGLRSSLNNQVTLNRTDTNYALLPVWIYHYQYKEEDYCFHINGQTGKIIGKVPVSKGKVWGYGATVFAALFAILMLVRQLLFFL